MIGFWVLFSFSERDLIDFFHFDYYSFYYSGPLVRGISDCDTHISSFKIKRAGPGRFGGPAGIRAPDQGIMSTQGGSDRL